MIPWAIRGRPLRGPSATRAEILSSLRLWNLMAQLYTVWRDTRSRSATSSALSPASSHSRGSLILGVVCSYMLQAKILQTSTYSVEGSCFHGKYQRAIAGRWLGKTRWHLRYELPVLLMQLALYN